MKVMYDTGARGFFQWMKKRQPRLYKELSAKMSPGSELSGFGDIDPVATSSNAPAGSGWASTLQSLITTGAQAYLTTQQMSAQKKLLDVQLSRAQQGLPPMDLDPYQYGLQPTVRAGVTADTKQMLLYGGLGLAAVILLPKLLGSRR